VDGVIAVAWHASECFEALYDIKKAGKPFVVLDHHNSVLEFPNVTADNYHGGWLAAEHLFEQGHRTFTFVGDYRASTVLNRLNGFRDYLAEQDVAFPHSQVADIRLKDYFGSWESLIDGKLEKVFSSSRRPTAVFASCDRVAQEVYRWCAARKIRIPEDVSVVGFDDEPVAKVLNLTTLAQPFDAMGVKAMELLKQQFDGHPWNGKETILPVQLIVRDSVKELK